jgi:hypothetical protein
MHEADSHTVIHVLTLTLFVDTNMVSKMHSNHIIWDWSNKTEHPYIN